MNPTLTSTVMLALSSGVMTVAWSALALRQKKGQSRAI